MVPFKEGIFRSKKSTLTHETCVDSVYTCTRVISKEMHRMQYLRNRTPDVQESVIVLQCSPPSAE